MQNTKNLPKSKITQNTHKKKAKNFAFSTLSSKSWGSGTIFSFRVFHRKTPISRHLGHCPRIPNIFAKKIKYFAPNIFGQPLLRTALNPPPPPPGVLAPVPPTHPSPSFKLKRSRVGPPPPTTTTTTRFSGIHSQPWAGGGEG